MQDDYYSKLGRLQKYKRHFRDAPTPTAADFEIIGLIVALEDTLKAMVEHAAGRQYKRRFQVAAFSLVMPDSADYAAGVREW